jgi:hypothetical protein
MLATLVRDWRTAAPLQRFQLSFVQTAEAISEDSLLAGRGRPVDNPAWGDVWEPRVLIQRLSLTLGKREHVMKQTIVAAVGLHALARWFARNRDTSAAALLRDLGLLARSTDFRTPLMVPTPGGRWVGDYVGVRDDAGEYRVLSARTFLSAEMDEA